MLVLMAAVLVMVAGASMDPAQAQKRNRNNGEDPNKYVIANQKFAKAILEAQTALLSEPVNPQLVLQHVNTALAVSGINRYEKGVAYRMQAAAYIEIDNRGAAIRSFENMFSQGDIRPNEVPGLRMNLGQLYIGEEQFRRGAEIIERAIREGAPGHRQIKLMLAQVWAPEGEYRRALP